MTNHVDLHSHTTASDGTFSPAENVKRAMEKGLAAIGITDHDTVAGLDEAIRAGDELGVEVIPGIEISSSHQGQDIHVLGYYVDRTDTRFLQRLEELRDTRYRRNQMMIERLNELGIDITLEEVYARKKREGGNIGRPHMAEVLMEKGIVGSVAEAFETYLGKEGKAYVNPPRISPQEAINLIQAAGGVAVLAHPGLYGDDGMVEQLIHHGLDGIEVFHPDHGKQEEERYLEIGNKHGLIISAGSDFHGIRNGEIFHADIGTKTVGMETVERLKEKARSR